MVRYYENADCSLKSNIIVLLIIIFGTTSFRTGNQKRATVLLSLTLRQILREALWVGPAAKPAFARFLAHFDAEAVHFSDFIF